MIRILKAATAREAIHQALLAQGFERDGDFPFTHGDRLTEWRRGDGRIGFSSNAVSGVGVFVVIGPDEEQLVRVLDAAIPTLSAGDAASAAIAAVTPGKRARAMFVLRDIGRYLRYEPSLVRETIAAPIREAILANEAPLRAAAVDAAFGLQWGELDEAFETLGQRPDFAWLGARWSKVRGAVVAREAKEAAARASAERLTSLAALVEAQRWDEAASIARLVFDDTKPPPLVAWKARALSAAGLGRAWEGALFAAAWVAKRGGEEAEAALARAAKALSDDDTDIVPVVLEVHRWLDDVDESIQTVEALLRLEPARATELAFVTSALRLRLSYLGDVQRAALPFVTRAAEAFPTLVVGHALHAQCFAALDDLVESEAAIRRALVHADAPFASPREEALTRLFNALSSNESTGAPTRAELLVSLVWYHESRSRHDDVARLTAEILAMPLATKTRAKVLRSRAIALTFTNQHDAAIAAYREAIPAAVAAEVELDGLLHFNFSCELAKSGAREEALSVLKEAIALDAENAKKSRGDEYFEALWEDSAFILATAALEGVPSREEVETSIRRTLGRIYRGEGEEALVEGNRAVAGAELLGDPALVARALHQLGSALTYHASPARGIRTLERAVSLAADALKDDPSEHAQIIHSLGAALHAANRLDEAEVRYREALAARIAAFGESHVSLGNSYGDLARLASSRGLFEEADALMDRTIEVLEAVVRATPEGEDQWDALVNLALVEGNRTNGAVERELGAEEIVVRATKAVGRLETLVAAGARVPDGTILRLRRCIAHAASADMTVLERATNLSQRLLEIEEPDPRVRAERLFWAGLRYGARELRQAGHEDRVIAECIARAVRGQDPGEPLTLHRAFDNLTVELATRLTSRGDLVMIAMSLDLAASGHETVDKALEGLEAFAVANAMGIDRDSFGDDEDDEDEDDGDDD